MWYPTKVPKMQFVTMTTQKTVAISGNGMTHLPAIACHRKDWCRLFCEKSEAGKYLLSNMFAAPFLEFSMSGDELWNCWTKRPKYNKVSSLAGQIKFHSAGSHSGMRPPENLLDGIYNFDSSSCFRVEDRGNLYVVFDFGDIVEVNKVMLVSRKSANAAANTFRLIDIRVGSTAPTGNNFSSFEQLDYFDGAATEGTYIFETNAKNTISGSFLSISSFSLNKAMDICHLEIY